MTRDEDIYDETRRKQFGKARKSKGRKSLQDAGKRRHRPQEEEGLPKWQQNAG